MSTENINDNNSTLPVYYNTDDFVRVEISTPYTRRCNENLKINRMLDVMFNGVATGDRT